MTNAANLYGRPWSEPEFIIVLDAYFAHRHEPRHSGCDYVRKAAAILGRTPAAVAMRMENYASIDPDLGDVRVGLTHINTLGRRIFEYWIERQGALRECAQAFIRDSRRNRTPNLFDPDPVRLPRAFDQYELLDLIGEGGTGTVFSCIHFEKQEVFAIKIIRADRIHEPEALPRFRREIRALKAISHPNIIRLHEDNLDDERHFPAYVMDFADCSLAAHVDRVVRERRPDARPVLPGDEAVAVILAACDAVIALHSNQPRIIHRDINPHNLLRAGDRWILADFGLAKFLSTAPMTTSFQTSTGRGWGTAWYPPPEQYRSFADTDERSDIYSLGILLWELFSELDPPPERERTGLPANLEAVFLRATSRDPHARYRTVNEFKSAFLASAEFR